MALAETLRRLRAEQFLTQAQLAEKAGVAKVSIARLEVSRARPYRKTVCLLAAALGVAPRALADPHEVAEELRPPRRH